MSKLTLSLLAIAAAAVVAGCIGGDDTQGGNETNGNATDDLTAAPLPAPIEASEDVTGSVDPLPIAPAGIPPCEAPSAQCFRYPFELNSTATISVALSWGVPANDFDVYIFADGEQLTTTEGGSSPPGDSEAFDLDLDPGSYEVVVSAYAVSQDTFTLSATFS